MYFSISVSSLPSGRESRSKTPWIPSIDHDEIASRNSALTHPKSMKASIKWVIGGVEVSRKLRMSRYWLESRFLWAVSRLLPVEESFDRGRVWEADSGISWLSQSRLDPALGWFFLWLRVRIDELWLDASVSCCRFCFFRWRRFAWSCKIIRVAKYSFFSLSSAANSSGCRFLSCGMCGNEFNIIVLNANEYGLPHFL